LVDLAALHPTLEWVATVPLGRVVAAAALAAAAEPRAAEVATGVVEA
jgi:hypothetical protein